MAIDTKSMIIVIATTLFQHKGYMGIGLNEILKGCNITKSSLYHHFPNGRGFYDSSISALERF